MSTTLTLLRALRIKARISQTKFAKLLDVSQPVISNWESGLQIPVDRGPAILKILDQFIDVKGITVEELSKPYVEATRSH